ncbi:MAG: phosphoglucosamine mutase [Acidobacteria bacterium]|nr:phosphoglucosamine mutase [Acidobacteriota bacterium]
MKTNSANEKTVAKELFGTDGIRGVAGKPPLDPKTVFVIGKSLGEFLSSKTSRPRVLIGEDTRESSRWISETLAAGLREAGVEACTPGVLTTPGLAYATSAEGFSCGVMISASHNPYQDNGIKVFESSGYKLPDLAELAVEGNIFAALSDGQPIQPRRLAMQPQHRLVAPYVEFLRRRAQGIGKPPARRVIMDCANGSAAALAREVFSGFGLDLTLIADAPDGRNINLDCGSLHLKNLQRAVLRAKAEVGVAFDGDADRALFVTGRGRIVNGDGVLLIASRYLKRRGELRSGVVVGTVMTNLGLEHALEQEGLRLLRTPVGDKYVLEEMLRLDANLGGEPSGHIIFRDLATTGDGLLTAVEMLRIISESGQELERLVDGLREFPQTIRNLRVREKIPFAELPRVSEQIHSSEQSLGTAGRIVVRYSGTEPVVRVMVEAESEALVERHASAIVRAIEQSIGTSPTPSAG